MEIKTKWLSLSEESDNAMEKQQKTILLKLCLLGLFLAFLAIITVNYAARITATISNPAKFRELLLSYRQISILVFIFFQFIVVIIAPIPGELILLAGGYIFGTLFGTIYSLIGILLGSTTVFFISKFFGFSLIKSLISPKKLAKLQALVNNQRSELTLFFFYLIPEMPKDILTYLAGLTPINPFKFIAFSTIARLPCVIGSTFIGSTLKQKNYLAVIILLVITGILSLFVLIMRKKIINKINNFLVFKNAPKKD
jgi:uncharacterized membrane protein YdjX (TVP38/TMEM64 family)